MSLDFTGYSYELSKTDQHEQQRQAEHSRLLAAGRRGRALLRSGYALLMSLLG